MRRCIPFRFWGSSLFQTAQLLFPGYVGRSAQHRVLMQSGGETESLSVHALQTDQCMDPLVLTSLLAKLRWFVKITR